MMNSAYSPKSRAGNGAKRSSFHGPHLGRSLGCRDPEHIARWVEAQNAGRRGRPTCTAIAARTGKQCQLLPMRGAQCCVRHARGKDADRANALLAAAATDIIEVGGSAIEIERAHRTLARIARRELHQLWRTDPRIVGSTLALDERDEAAVADWLLRRHHIRLDQNLPGAQHAPTPRCVDRLRWAAHRVLRRGGDVTSELLAAADRRVELAVRDDARFWARLAAMAAE